MEHDDMGTEDAPSPVIPMESGVEFAPEELPPSTIRRRLPAIPDWVVGGVTVSAVLVWAGYCVGHIPNVVGGVLWIGLGGLALWAGSRSGRLAEIAVFGQPKVRGWVVVAATGLAVVVWLGYWAAGIVDLPSPYDAWTKAEGYVRERLPLTGEVRVDGDLDNRIRVGENGDVYCYFYARENPKQEWYGVGVTVERHGRWWGRPHR